MVETQTTLICRLRDPEDETSWQEFVELLQLSKNASHANASRVLAKVHSFDNVRQAFRERFDFFVGVAFPHE